MARINAVRSIGLGGGSLVRRDGETGRVSIGPKSVGHYLTTESLVFGGSTLTATDVAVASGDAAIGDKDKVTDLDQTLVEGAKARIRVLLDLTLDSMKTSSAVSIFLSQR